MHYGLPEARPDISALARLQYEPTTQNTHIMDTAVKANYADVVKRTLLKEERRLGVGDLVSRVVFDDERSTYLLLTVGTDDNEDVFEVSIAVSIAGNGKVKIERDMTDFGLVDSLLESGVVYTDIIR
jgi:hypothetical protein